MKKVWSTTDVHPRDRRAYWVEALSGSISRVRCEPLGDQPFFPELVSDEAGKLRCTTYSSVTQSLVRASHQIGHWPSDSVTIGVQMAGRGFGTQVGRDIPLCPGDLVLFDMSRPLQLHFPGDFARTTLIAPRAELVRRLSRLEHFVGRPVEGHRGLGAVLSPLLGKLPANLMAITAATRERPAENLLDLIATALLPLSDWVKTSSDMAIVQVKAWIEAHLGEELSADSIAARFQISVRHLNRLFKQAGTGLMHYVWERRLIRCHRDLTTPGMRKRSITDIAFAAGFNDLSHFSRAYRPRYGRTPSEARRYALPPPH